MPVIVAQSRVYALPKEAGGGKRIWILIRYKGGFLSRNTENLQVVNLKGESYFFPPFFFLNALSVTS